MVNTHKKKFGDKLHLAEITSIIYISKGEQVWVLGAERLSLLNVKLYKSYKWTLLDISCLARLSHLDPEMWQILVFKVFETSSP